MYKPAGTIAVNIKSVAFTKVIAQMMAEVEDLPFDKNDPVQHRELLLELSRRVIDFYIDGYGYEGDIENPSVISEAVHEIEACLKLEYPHHNTMLFVPMDLEGKLMVIMTHD